VYGASAGAINATYFLTGQREGVDIYPEDIANKTFCDVGRLVGRNAGGCSFPCTFSCSFSCVPNFLLLPSSRQAARYLGRSGQVSPGVRSAALTAGITKCEPASFSEFAAPCQ